MVSAFIKGYHRLLKIYNRRIIAYLLEQSKNILVWAVLVKRNIDKRLLR